MPITVYLCQVNAVVIVSVIHVLGAMIVLRQKDASGALEHAPDTIGNVVHEKGGCDKKAGYGEPNSKHVFGNIIDGESAVSPVLKVDGEEGCNEGHGEENNGDNGKHHDGLAYE